MKNKTKNFFGALILVLAFVCSPIQASYNNETTSNMMIAPIGDALIGGWQYTVEGAPEGYGKGLLMIVNQNGVYKAQVQINNQTVLADNVVVKGNKITFNVLLDDEKVVVALQAKGSKLSGTSTSPSKGVLNITGVKTISPQ